MICYLLQVLWFDAPFVYSFGPVEYGMLYMYRFIRKFVELDDAWEDCKLGPHISRNWVGRSLPSPHISLMTSRHSLSSISSWSSTSHRSTEVSLSRPLVFALKADRRACGMSAESRDYIVRRFPP